jgi:predicted transcriptional regulator of viral defense system
VNYEIELVEMIKNNNGMILTSQVDEAAIPREYLSILIKKGFIDRIARGVYLTKDALDDEMYRLQMRYSKGIFSQGTALFLHDLTDRTPLYYTMTFQNNYHTQSLKEEGVTAYYVDKKHFEIGKIEMSSPFGRTILTYDLERTICDIIRKRNQMDSYVVREACKRYVKRNEKSLNTLMSYAATFKIENVVRQNIEVHL